jgi:hypothetical protein
MHAIAGRAFGWLLCQIVDCQLRAENTKRFVDVEGSGVASSQVRMLKDQAIDHATNTSYCRQFVFGSG